MFAHDAARLSFITACVVLTCLSSTEADLVQITNSSFEDPDVADGSAVAAVPDWSFATGGTPLAISAGVHDQLDVQYVGATGDNSPLPERLTLVRTRLFKSIPHWAQLPSEHSPLAIWRQFRPRLSTI